MIAASGQVLVLDFGIAKLLADGAAPTPLTGQGTWLGTPGYMAPEQWSADGAGPASDRYALGVIAYELLAGKPPFSASSVPAMMEQHFRAEVPPLGLPVDSVAFASDDVVIDERGSDASCQVPVHLEYHYDPRANTLEVRRPVVQIDIVDGHCVPRSHETTIERLTRVDEAHDTLDFPAPRGNPIAPKNPPQQRPRSRPTPAYTSNAQILPEPQATVPVQQAAPPEIQQQQKQ